MPDQSIADARQALSLDDMTALVGSLTAIAQAVGRRFGDRPTPAARVSVAGYCPA